MSTVRLIAKNTASLFLSNLIGRIFGFFFVMYAARYLEAGQFGVLSSALALVGIFGILPEWGLTSLMVREVARDRTLVEKYIANVTVIRIVLAAVTFLLIAITVNLLGYPQQTAEVIYLIAFSVILSVFNNVFNAAFQAFEMMEYSSIGGVLNSFLILIGALYAISQGYNVIAFAYIYVVSNLVVLIFSLFISTSRCSGLRTKADPQFCIWVMKESFPFFISSIFATIAYRIDMVMLSIMKGDAIVGWYSAAYKLLDVSIVIPAVFVLAIYPSLSKFFVSSQNALKLSYEKSFKYLSVLAIPLAVGTTILAERIILLIYQSGYDNSVGALQVLIWTVPMVFLNYVSGTTLASINKQNLLTRIFFITMISNIILNLVLIPGYSYVGAALATVLTEMASFILCYYFLSKLIYRVPLSSIFLKPALSSAIMLLFDIYFLYMNLYILIFASMIVYAISFILMGGVSKDDYALFREIFISRNVKG
jgi:O-antigen/teichoic acid export membrane protein